MPPKRRAQTIYSSEVEDTTVGRKNGIEPEQDEPNKRKRVRSARGEASADYLRREASERPEGQAASREVTHQLCKTKALEDRTNAIAFYDKPSQPNHSRNVTTMRPHSKQRLPTVHESLAPSGFRHSKSNQSAPTNSQRNHTAIPPPPHTYSGSQPLRITSVHSGSQHGPDSQQRNDPSDVVDDQPTPALHPATKPIPNPYAGMEKQPVNGDMSVPSDLDIPEHQPDDYDNDGSNEDGNYEHNGGARDEAVEHGGGWDYIPSEDWPRAEEGDCPAVDLEQEHQTSSPKRHHHARHSAKASDTNNPPPTPATRSAAAAFPCHIYLLVQHACYYIKAVCAAEDPYPCYERQVEIVRHGWSDAVWDAKENGDEGQQLEPYREVYFSYITIYFQHVRSDIKTAAKNLVGEAYGLSKRRSAWRKNREIYKSLIEDDKYTCENPETGDGRWFQQLLYDVVQVVFFTNKQGSMGIVYKDLFKPLSLPTIALVYTAIRCAIDEYAKGKYVSHRFEAPDYEPVYRAHLLNLKRFASKSVAAAKFLQQDLWKKLSGLAVAVSKSAVLSEAVHDKAVADALRRQAAQGTDGSSSDYPMSD
ncbi:hypothetical protein FRB99_007494 [Tulasnella sp. 403]|nr:hypothetical protein FRB99_007494 [Tulasnella sp. 403]